VALEVEGSSPSGHPRIKSKVKMKNKKEDATSLGSILPSSSLILIFDFSIVAVPIV
jgi:hypothetical protein